LNIGKIAIAGVCAAIGGGHAFASTPMTIQAKPGVTFMIREQDRTLCAEVGHRAPETDLTGINVDFGMAIATGGVVGGALGGVVAGMIEEKEAREVAASICMHNMGYAGVPLTADEEDAYRRLASTGRREWEAAFLVSDFSVRYRALTTPQVPPLPAYREAPFAHGGLKIDGDSLKLVATSIDDSGDLVTGTATRWRTATLATPIETTEGPIRVAVDAGTVFHQVDYRPQFEHWLRAESATWCGPARQTASDNVTIAVYCFTGRSNGYEVYGASGQPWFAGAHTDGPVLPVYGQPIRLEERAQDDLGPMDFAISIAAVHFRTIDLVATVRHDGRQSVVWSRTMRLSPANTIVLPLWTWRLKLKRISGGPVLATFDHDGDGTGWRNGN
jgi:hypothetical protein